MVATWAVDRLGRSLHHLLEFMNDLHAKGVDLYYTRESFGNRMRKWCDTAGLPECSSHGFRKASSAQLAEAGCSENEIKAITPHKTSKEVSRYAHAANQRRLAENAIARLPQGQKGNESVPLSETVEEGGTISRPKSLKAKV